MLRRLFWQLATILPLIATGYMGLLPKTRGEALPEFSDDPTTQARIAAYAEPVRASYALTDSKKAVLPQATVRAVATVWIRGLESGLLRPLPPLHYRNGFTEGIKAQIYEARQFVLASLHRLAGSRENEGRVAEAIETDLSALKVGEVLKYSDMTTLLTSCSFQARTVRRLRSLEPKMTAAQRSAVASAVRAIALSPEEFKRIAARVGMQYAVYESNKNGGRDTEPIELAMNKAEQIIANGDLAQMDRDLKSLIVRDQQELAAILCSLRRIASEARRLEGAREGLLASLAARRSEMVAARVANGAL